MSRKTAIPKKQRTPGKKLGFFDVDSRELSRSGKKLAFQNRVKPIAAILNGLYEFCRTNNLPLVFTTCCSGKFLEKDSFDDILYVPGNKNDRVWEKWVGDYRVFYIEKRQYGNPRINSERCAYDFFRYNSNAIRLLKNLKTKTWAVAGNGFDLCVYRACLNLLKNGFKLILIEDAVAPAWGYGGIGTEKNKNKIIRELKKMGVEIIKAKRFLKKYAGK